MGTRAIAWGRRMDAGVVVLPALVWLAFHNGGYFPTTWNATSAALLLATAGLMLSGLRPEVGRLDVYLVIGLGALVLWTALSALWSIAPAESILESQRTFLYLVGATLMILVASRRGVRPMALTVGSVFVIVCGDALFERLVSVDSFPSDRLGGPVGYANALAIIAAVGVVLAVTAIAQEQPKIRAAAGAAVPVLIAALYLTFSRSAWLLLAIALLLLTRIDRRRREGIAAVAVLTVPCAAVIVGGATARALTNPRAPHAAVTADAHRLAVLVLVSALSAAWAVRLTPVVARRLRIPHVVRAGFGAYRYLLPVLVAVAVGSVIAAAGPAHVASRISDAVNARPPKATNLNAHLFTLSGTGRADMWRVALSTFVSRPIAGNGAGTFNRLWLMHRKRPIPVQDAHSLYLETLTELGGVGLALLLGVLAVPLVAARRLLGAARSERVDYLPVLSVTYVILLAHAAVDWDWEMPIVMMAALACGTALVAAARDRPRPLGRRARISGLGASLVLAGCASLLFIGNRDLSAAASSRPDQLAAAARTAQRWVPWSPDPLRWEGLVALQNDDRQTAERLLTDAIAKDRSDWTLWIQLATASQGARRRSAIAEARRLNPRGPELRRAEIADGLRLPRVRKPSASGGSAIPPMTRPSMIDHR